jgi:hypothetical protein
MVFPWFFSFFEISVAIAVGIGQYGRHTIDAWRATTEDAAVCYRNGG